MSRTKARKRRAGPPRNQRTRIRSWLPLLGVALVGLVAAAVYVWTTTGTPDKAGTVGGQVRPFELPDVVSGRNVSLADYLGQKEIVIVGYMGWFCLGCEELLVELQKRQTDFEKRGVALLALGSKPESRDLAEQKARAYGITYPILYDADTRVTREVGLWSSQMEMPWMGYVIVDKTSRVVASDLQLAEAKGAAPKNVDTILAALDRAMASR